jgi:hypothetical protein
MRTMKEHFTTEVLFISEKEILITELDRLDESLRDLKTAIVFSNKEVVGFANLFGENRTLFDKSMALLEGERGPWSIVMNEDEFNKLNKCIEN